MLFLAEKNSQVGFGARALYDTRILAATAQWRMIWLVGNLKTLPRKLEVSSIGL